MQKNYCSCLICYNHVIFQMFVRIVQASLKKDAVFRGVLENLASVLTPVKKVIGKNLFTTRCFLIQYWSIRKFSLFFLANPSKVYTQACQKCVKLWPQFLDTIMKVKFLTRFNIIIQVYKIFNSLYLFFISFSGWADAVAAKANCKRAELFV